MEDFAWGGAFALEYVTFLLSEKKNCLAIGCNCPYNYLQYEIHSKCASGVKRNSGLKDGNSLSSIYMCTGRYSI